MAISPGSRPSRNGNRPPTKKRPPTAARIKPPRINHLPSSRAGSIYKIPQNLKNLLRRGCPPTFFHKSIIPKELVTRFVQRYHSTEFNERLMETAEYVSEAQLTLHPV